MDWSGRLMNKELQLIVLMIMQASCQAFIPCPDELQKGCIIERSKMQCKCSQFALCPGDPNFFNTRHECEKRLWGALGLDCGIRKFWACRVDRRFASGRIPDCHCHNRTACVGYYGYDHLAQCESDLEREYNTRIIAPIKCKLDDLFQEPIRCGQSRKFCTVYGCQSCCHSWSGCNPNPFLYATTDRCHLGVPSELWRDPCKAVKCKAGFMCTTDAKLCQGDRPCSQFQSTSYKEKLYCVINPSFNPCRNHYCSTGRRCYSSLAQKCSKPPCAASAVCQIDPMYDPCKFEECNPGEMCKAEDGKMCENNVCIKEAHCYPDPDAGPPNIRLLYVSNSVEVAGNNITLICEAVANPSLTSLDFYHNGNVVTHETNNVEICHRQSGNTSTVHLIITSGSDSHSGNYTCTATNFLGYDSQHTELSVHECPSCNVTNIGKQLCSSNTAVMGKAGRVIETSKLWTSYEFTISRVIGRFTTINLANADINQSVTMTTKSSDCPCQTMLPGRNYLAVFNFKATGRVINLFPNGRVYLWQTVRDLVKDDTLQCK